jgi:hypothetical protein
MGFEWIFRRRRYSASRRTGADRHTESGSLQEHSYEGNGSHFRKRCRISFLPGFSANSSQIGRYVMREDRSCLGAIAGKSYKHKSI